MSDYTFGHGSFPLIITRTDIYSRSREVSKPFDSGFYIHNRFDRHIDSNVTDMPAKF